MMNSTGGPLVEGNLALDLVNTEEIRRGIRRDFISSAEEFSLWLTTEELAGAVSHVQLPFEVEVWSSDDLERVHEVRSEVRELLERVAEGGQLDSGMIRRLESYTEQAPYTLRLHEGRVLQVPVGKPVERLCSLVAGEILELIGQGKIEYLRRCANPNCLFMFVDESGRRKWCSMKRCGNRMKVMKHAMSKNNK